MKFLFFSLAEFSRFPSYKRVVGMGESLAKLGHDVHIAVLDCQENRLRMAVEAPSCNPVWITSRNPLSEVWKKFRAVYSLKPDVIYSPSFSLRNLAYCGLALPRRIKRVIEFCELYSVYLYGRPSRFWRFNEWFACWENTHILCASKYLESHFASAMESWHNKRRLCYSPYAYPPYLTPTDTPRKSTKKVLFMASLWRGYGIYDVMEAYLKVRNQMEGVELEVLGNGPERRNVERWVVDHGLSSSIHIRGYVAESELNGYFSQADVFIAPLRDSIQDRARCPSKLFYYIPYNKPIVTCMIGDPYETLGDEGFYYVPEDIDSMAHAIMSGLLASDTFSYPKGFVARHSWTARAESFLRWISE